MKFWISYLGGALSTAALMGLEYGPSLVPFTLLGFVSAGLFGRALREAVGLTCSGCHIRGTQLESYEAEIKRLREAVEVLDIDGRP